jgi:dienelactone hydrolase
VKRAALVALALACSAACVAPEPGDVDAGAPGTDAGPPARAPVTLTTDDGKSLDGFVVTGQTAPAGSPGVVLLHQYQSDHQQWGELPERLVLEGWRVLAFSYRGHGASDAYDGALVDILTDPDGAPVDVAAALAWLADEGQADVDRLALVGTSIGANLAVAGAIDGAAKTYVAISARQPPAEALAGASATGMRSVFYLAGENDPGGQAADSTNMFDATAEPRELKIYEGTAAHGSALLDPQYDVAERVIAWLADTL